MPNGQAHLCVSVRARMQRVCWQPRESERAHKELQGAEWAGCMSTRLVGQLFLQRQQPAMGGEKDREGPGRLYVHTVNGESVRGGKSAPGTFFNESAVV